jgi:hypothetical protein
MPPQQPSQQLSSQEILGQQKIPSPNNWPESNKRSPKTKLIFATSIIFLLAIITSGGLLIKSHLAKAERAERATALAQQQAQITKQKQLQQEQLATQKAEDEAAAKLKAEQQAQEAQKNSAQAALAVPSNQDVTTIKKFTSSYCETGSKFTGPEITKTYLQSKADSGALHYYNGYAQISVGCSSDPLGGTSYLQRQADSSWIQIFGSPDTPNCSSINAHKVPAQIAPNCLSGSGTKIPNQN